MKQQQNKVDFIPWRYYTTLLVILGVVFSLGWRIYNLTIIEQPFLRKQGDERVLRIVSTPAFRGMIVDRNGFPLAVSTRVYSAWMNPQEFNASKKETQTLANLLNLKERDIETLALKNSTKKREFIYLKRTIPPPQAEQIKALNLAGIYLEEAFHRYYPEGEIAAQILGFTNIDDHGQEGLELAYNQWLEGELGKKLVIKDRLGRVIADLQTISEQKPGHDLVLSIDRRVQYIAYTTLMKSVIDNQAASGSAIVLNAKTGEVLAMVNYPSFNPNNHQKAQPENFRNRAVTDTFEPGSTIKPFTVARAFSISSLKPNSVINTNPGWLRVGHNVVNDEKNNGPLTITQILQISSNVGLAKIVLGLPPDKFWSLLRDVGFGEISNIGFPGEQSGSLVKHDPWGDFTFVNMARGYGISVTALQLAHAYLTLANKGIKIPMTLLRKDQKGSLPSQRVIPEKIANQVLSMLEFVLAHGGTGVRATVEGYRVAGKTGTSKLVGEFGYEKHRYNSSFVGIAPLSDPQVVVMVVIHDPRGKYYLGGDVSGPAFAKITESTLRLLDIPPDGINS